MSLSWGASNDNTTITAYVIQRCSGSACANFSQVGSVPSGTTFTDSGLSASTVYQYRVYATDSASTSSPFSNVVAGTTLPNSAQGSVSYGYDALGRLVQATVPALNIVENYTYDMGGNLLSETSSPLSTLAVSNLSTAQSVPGNTITIFGSGFSTTASSNTVKFNGVAATVVSATTTQLQVVIPPGATSGPVTVQTGSTSASSAGSFTVSSSSTAAPTLSYVPTVSIPGATITLVGTGFQSIAANNKVQINNTWAAVTSATPTTLNVVVPPIVGTPNTFGTVAGPISVTTPYGTVTSSSPLMVSKLTFAAIGSLSINGPAVTLPATASNGYAELFTGASGQNLVLNVTDNNLSNDIAISVIAPDGSTLVFDALLNSSGGVQIPALPQSGTYIVYAQISSGGNVGNAVVQLVGTVTSTLTLNGPSTPVNLSIPGEAASLTFNGTQNAYVALAFSNVTLSSATITVLNPDGSVLASSPLNTSGATLLPQLPATGTYTVQVVPSGAVSGSFAAALTAAASPTLAVNQAPYNLTLTNATPVTLTFEAQSGQYLSLAASQTGSICSAIVTALKPDGSQLIGTSWNFCASTNQVLSLGPFAEAGTYSVVIQQSGSASGTLALTLAKPVPAQVTVGSTTSQTITLNGQGLAATFPGAAGQYLSAALTSSATGTAITSGTISVLDPSGAVLATQAFTGQCSAGSCAGSGVVSVGPLPGGGTYTALFQQTTGTYGASTGGMLLTLDQAVQGTVTAGTATGVNVGVGQGIQYTLAASEGQYMSVAFTSAANTLIPTAGTLTILDPNGGRVSSASYSGSCASSSCSGSGVINAGPLPLSGNYTLLFQQTNSVNGPASGTVTLTPELAATGSLTVGSPATVTLATGQGLVESITGAAGQYLSMALIMQGATAATGGTISIVGPDGSVLATAPYSGSCSAGSCSAAGNLNVGPLPVAGTYSLVFQQANGSAGPGSGSIVITPEAAATGTLTLGSPATVTLANGQGIQQTFAETANDYDTVTVSETNGHIQGATVSVLSPAGVQLATGTLSATCSTTCSGTVSLNLGPLPTSGNYTVLVQQATQPPGFGAGSLSVLVSKNNIGTGSTQTLNTSTPGQAAQFTFQAAAIQPFNLTFTNMAFAPSSVTSYSIAIAAPSGTNVYNNSCNSATCELTLNGVITQTGTYTVTVTPGGAATMTGTAILSTSVLGSLTLGTAFNLNLSIGQGALLTFSAAANQTLMVNVSGINSTPANAYYNISVNGPTGNSIGFASVSTGTVINLPNLAAGSYTIAITPGNPPASSTMQVTVAAGAVDVLPLNGTGVNISTSTPGENAYFTYSGTYGESVSLAFTNFSVTPATSSPISLTPGVRVPFDGNSYCYTPGCATHLPYLPSTGTFTAALSPGQATMSATAYLTPDVTGALSYGTPLNLSLSEIGQSALLTFNVTPQTGPSPALYVANSSKNPTTSQYTLNVLSVDQNYMQVLSTTGAGGLLNGSYNLPNLPVGSYVVVIEPSPSAPNTPPGVASLQLTLSPTLTVALPADGSAVNETTPVPGQAIYLTFPGVAGQSMDLALTNVSVTPNISGTISASVTTPQGNALTSTNCAFSTGSCELNVGSLPLTGNYTIAVTPTQTSGGVPVQMSFTARMPPAATGSLSLNSPVTESLTVAGQAARLTFTATAGQTLALGLGSITTTPSGNSVTATVYDANGNPVGVYANGNTSSTQIAVNLQNLSAGTYTVVIAPTTVTTDSMQVTLASGVTGALVADGSSHSYATTVPGQNAYFTFSGTAGQNLSLGFSNVTVTPNTVVNVSLYNPDGTFATRTTCSTSTSSVPGCALAFQNLPQTGVYSVQLVPSSPATMSFTEDLTQDLSAILSPGVPSSLALSSFGQNADIPFRLSSTQTVTIHAGSIVTNPVGGTVAFYVYNKFGALVGGASGTSTASVNLSNLAAGTYSLYVVPSNGATATLQVTATGIDMPADTSGDGPLPPWSLCLLALSLMGLVARAEQLRGVRVTRRP